MGEGVACPCVILSWVSASDGLPEPIGTRDPDMTAMTSAWDNFDAEAQKADGQPILDLFAAEPFDFESEHAAAMVLEIAPGVPVRVVRLEALLEMKRAADRPQDRADIAELSAIRGGPDA